MSFFGKVKKRIRLSKKNKLHIQAFGTRTSLERDWKIIMSTFLILLVAVCAVGLYFYVRVSAQDIFSADTPAAEDATILNRSELHDALERIEEDRAIYDGYRDNPIVIPDPS